MKLRSVLAVLISVITLVAAPTSAAEQSGSLKEKAKEAGESVKQAGVDAMDSITGALSDAKKAVTDAGEDAADAIGDLWKKVDRNRLKNRSRDEVVAWVIVGLLVGSVAGAFTQLKTSGMGQLGRIAIGLAGAALGGMVVRVAKLDFGWGPVLVRYEDLLFAAAGAVLLIAIGKLFRLGSRKKPAEK